MKKTCTKCNDTTETESDITNSCSVCGNDNPGFIKQISISDNMSMYDGIRLKKKNDNKTGKKKIEVESRDVWEKNISRDIMVKRKMLINRKDNAYFEEITNPVTGEVIHRCKEKLSDHTGHGNAKKTLCNKM
jgi:hypothetical protein